MKTDNLGWCNVIDASKIRLRNGETYDNNPTVLRADIALLDDGEMWELYWSRGGDPNGISSEDLDDIEAIGGIYFPEPDGESLAEGLRRGAMQLRSWATEIVQINDANESLGLLADYLHERASAADDAADEADEADEADTDALAK